MPGTLYLVATPIGNLQDMSIRAIATLKSVDLIACEDTRHTRKLLNHFDITTKAVSYHEHNEKDRADELAGLLMAGKSIAAVSDAGTPNINDPGLALVKKAIEVGASVIPIPGPTAFVNALVVSGLPTDSFFFGGFLPSKKGERIRRLKDLAEIPATLIFYEAPHRIAASIADCADILGDRAAAISRELTKVHEETVRGTLSELKKHFAAAKVRGEIVICIDKDNGSAPPPTRKGSLTDRLNELERSGIDHRTALKTAAKEFGLTRSEAYRLVEAEKKTLKSPGY